MGSEKRVLDSRLRSDHLCMSARIFKRPGYSQKSIAHFCSISNGTKAVRTLWQADSPLDKGLDVSDRLFWLFALSYFAEEQSKLWINGDSFIE